MAGFSLFLFYFTEEISFEIAYIKMFCINQNLQQ